MEVLGDEKESGGTETFDGELEFNKEELIPQISINVMSGCPGFNTVRVIGHIGKKTIYILLDSGSTHNFLDE